MTTLTILPLGLAVPVADGQTLLEAALSGGVRLRSSCRNGTCRTCLATLHQGAVRYRVEWPGVTPEERAEGAVLTCVAVPLGDVVLWQPLVDEVAGPPPSPADITP